MDRCGHARRELDDIDLQRAVRLLVIEIAWPPVLRLGAVALIEQSVIPDDALDERRQLAHHPRAVISVCADDAPSIIDECADCVAFGRCHWASSAMWYRYPVSGKYGVYRPALLERSADGA